MSQSEHRILVGVLLQSSQNFAISTKWAPYYSINGVITPINWPNVNVVPGFWAHFQLILPRYRHMKGWSTLLGIALHTPACMATMGGGVGPLWKLPPNQPTLKTHLQLGWFLSNKKWWLRDVQGSGFDSFPKKYPTSRWMNHFYPHEKQQKSLQSFRGDSEHPKNHWSNFGAKWR